MCWVFTNEMVKNSPNVSHLMRFINSIEIFEQIKMDGWMDEVKCFVNKREMSILSTIPTKKYENGHDLDAMQPSW